MPIGENDPEKSSFQQETALDPAVLTANRNNHMLRVLSKTVTPYELINLFHRNHPRAS